jgi:uncharacterized membrane protein YkvA (DUF1232 family)
MSVVAMTALVLAGAWLLTLLIVARHRPRAGVLAEGLRLLPDTLRLLRRLAADPAAPRGVRLRLWAVAAYLASPIDLIPDFLPGIGQADDLVLVIAVLRSALRGAGPDLVRRHWPGTPEGLERLLRIAVPGAPTR